MGRPGGCGKGVLATHTRWDRAHPHSRFQTDPSSPPCSLNKITFALLLQPAWPEAVWTQQAWQRAWANKLCLRGGSEPPLQAYAYFWEDNVNMVKQKDGGKKRMEKKKLSSQWISLKNLVIGIERLVERSCMYEYYSTYTGKKTEWLFVKNIRWV